MGCIYQTSHCERACSHIHQSAMAQLPEHITAINSSKGSRISIKVNQPVQRRKGKRPSKTILQETKKAMWRKSRIKRNYQPTKLLESPNRFFEDIQESLYQVSKEYAVVLAEQFADILLVVHFRLYAPHHPSYRMIVVELHNAPPPSIFIVRRIIHCVCRRRRCRSPYAIDDWHVTESIARN